MCGADDGDCGCDGVVEDGGAALLGLWCGGGGRSYLLLDWRCLCFFLAC